jgi:aminoglycoside phosphotransferase (APT) family kinase protein
MSEAKAGEMRAVIDVNGLQKYIHLTLGNHHGSVQEVKQFHHGQSNPTYLIKMTNGTKWVLRKKPHGKILPSAHAIEREYLVLKALEYTEVPVPKPILLCEDPKVIGTPFYLMSYVQGRIFQDPTLREIKSIERYAVYSAICDVLVKLHRLDYKQLGLEGFGKPEKYSQRVVARWSKQVHAGKQVFQQAGIEENPQLDALKDWLEGK